MREEKERKKEEKKKTVHICSGYFWQSAVLGIQDQTNSSNEGRGGKKRKTRAHVVKCHRNFDHLAGFLASRILEDRSSGTTLSYFHTARRPVCPATLFAGVFNGQGINRSLPSLRE